jgi:hypothetical protein
VDALRNSKKISLLAVAIIFLFTFFNLTLDAPHNKDISFRPQKSGIITKKHFPGRYPPQNLRIFNFLSSGCIQQFKTMILMCHMLGFQATTWLSTLFFKLNTTSTYGTSKRRSWPHNFKAYKDISFRPQKRGIITNKPLTARYQPQNLRIFNFSSHGCIQQFQDNEFDVPHVRISSNLYFTTWISTLSTLFSHLTQPQHMAHQNEGLGPTISKVIRIFHFGHKKVALSPKNPLQVDIHYKI